MKTVVITGAGGFIGGALTKHLLQKGITVYGIDISPELLSCFLAYDNFIPVIANFQQYKSLHKKVPSQSVDVFFHFAWQGVYGDAFKDYSLQLNNAIYACDAIEEAVKMAAKKFVFAGTMNEYEMDAYIGADYFEPRYTYIYSVAKQSSEAICKTIAFNKGIEFSAGRIAMAYGENNKSMMLPNIVMKNLINNVPCKLVKGDNLYDMIYIDDIVRAFEAIGEYGKNMKSYYVGHRTNVTFKELIRKIADVLNPRCPLLFGEYPDAPSGVDYANINVDDLYNDTGFECQADFDESIRRTAAWLKDNEKS